MLGMEGIDDSREAVDDSWSGTAHDTGVDNDHTMSSNGGEVLPFRVRVEKIARRLRNIVCCDYDIGLAAENFLTTEKRICRTGVVCNVPAVCQSYELIKKRPGSGRND